ncbi:MAG: extracellular solute-binding protein [Bacilli bacterium]|nr:extracellular solute-binding protein [Bacilli bacterium]
MKKTNLLLAASAVLALGSLASCNSAHYDVEITVYNWEDYIYDGTDDDGAKVEDSTIEAFEKAYKEDTGLSIKVHYKTVSTCEEMYTNIKTGQVSPDLCCPSDYMIQKMQSEGMLESLGYDSTEKKYTEGLDSANKYTSPYIKELFDKNELADYAVPYFWGTMGYTYDPSKVTFDEVNTWEFQWNPGAALKKKITIKDSVRDTYFTAVMHVYKEELDTLRSQYEMNAISAEQYNNSLSEIFNRHDTDTLSKASKALSDLTPNVTLEVDEGKNDMVTGKISVNLAWSGDAVFSIDEAEDAGKILNYVVPQEGSNVWFDGWCVLKGANVEASKAFLDFLCQPSVAANNMSYTGYTSPIAGQEIWDLALETYSIDAYDDVEEADCDEVDLSYFFDGTLDDGVEAKILVPTEERGRQFDAQYPTTDVITRCAIMKDFGEEGNEALYNMWSNFKASFIG